MGRESPVCYTYNPKTCERGQMGDKNFQKNENIFQVTDYQFFINKKVFHIALFAEQATDLELLLYLTKNAIDSKTDVPCKHFFA